MFEDYSLFYFRSVPICGLSNISLWLDLGYTFQAGKLHHWWGVLCMSHLSHMLSICLSLVMLNVKCWSLRFFHCRVNIFSFSTNKQSLGRFIKTMQISYSSSEFFLRLSIYHDSGLNHSWLWKLQNDSFLTLLMLQLWK